MRRNRLSKGVAFGLGMGVATSALAHPHHGEAPTLVHQVLHPVQHGMDPAFALLAIALMVTGFALTLSERTPLLRAAGVAGLLAGAFIAFG